LHQPLLAERHIHLIGKSIAARRRIGAERSAPAFGAGAMAGGERHHLVEKKQFAVALAPDLSLAALERKHATDPAARYISPPPRALIVPVQPATTIAHHCPARRGCQKTAERIDAIGERGALAHGSLTKMSKPTAFFCAGNLGDHFVTSSSLAWE